MESQLVLLISTILLFVVRPSSSQVIHYVQPYDLPSPDCPGQPCLTLDHYIHNADKYFTAGAKFIFLNGQYTLQGTVNLTSVSNITLTKEDHAEVRLICASEGALAFENTYNVTIEGLMFISQLDRRSITSLFFFVSSREIKLLNVTFEGNQQFRAINSSGSSITIVSCHFEDNIGNNGGALYAENSNITLKGSTFLQNKATFIYGGAIFALKSSINILKEISTHKSLNEAVLIGDSLATVFISNDALYGGAIYLENSTLTMSNTIITFANNSAKYSGGAISCLHSKINSTARNLHFLNNTARYLDGGAVEMVSSSLYFGNEVPYLPSLPGGSRNIRIDVGCGNSTKEGKVNITTIFSNNHARNGGAVFLYFTTASLSGTNMTFIRNWAHHGGAVFLNLSAVASNTEHLHFNSNIATGEGGAIASLNTSLIFGDTNDTDHHFINNSCGDAGGAIYHSSGLLAILGTSYFTENHAKYGGAIYKSNSLFLLSCRAFFTWNHAKQGGAISYYETGAAFFGALIVFRNNSAGSEGDVCFVNGRICVGGAIASTHSQITIHTQEIIFMENSAVNVGGAISTRLGSELTIQSSASFIQNTAETGGAIYVEQIKQATLYNIEFTGNFASALVIHDSLVTIGGKSKFSENLGERGGAVYAANSFIRLIDITHFLRNNASDVGGAIYGFNIVKFTFSGLTIFEENKAEGNGGGIYAVDANITFNNTVQFTSNSAQNGGAMFFESGAVLTLERGTNFTASYNHAAEYGGVIYRVDSGATTHQCEYNDARKDLSRKFFLSISYCFINIKGISLSLINFTQHVKVPQYIESYYNSAGKDGSYIYGGLMDKCQIFATSNSNQVGSTKLIDPLKGILQLTPSNDTNKAISSKPYQLCFCLNDSYIDCFGKYRVEAYRGQRFNVSLIATAQGDIYVTSTQVSVKLSSTARLNTNQSLQTIKNCSATAYNVYSTKDYEELVAYPTNGPCTDRGLATAVIEVTLLPCPEGLIQSREQCVCEERLQTYDAECEIDEMVLITKASRNFWMSTLYINESYQGLILYKTCPVEYCKSGNVSMTLNDLDIQCDFNRSGMLCGACATNYSLLLGSSTCEICSNAYISLLVPFAFAGLGLVSFLTILRLTVATGLINSLILYANIVQANKNLFFPPNTRNLLTVFIAWLNLDLGFKTCFYDGMDGYAQTWLQFAFPLYVWILISLIIISSRYSIKVSRLIGSNPIAVLATLLLLSYTKILKIIIEVFSFVKLDYPDDKKVTVWLKDANMPYMEHKHLILSVVTLCLVLFFFFPYTLLLLLGYKLYSFRCCKKYFRCWLIRLRSLLDSYYAPYNIHHQYWTGLMLLVRCVLYLVFSYNSLGETNGSLLVIIVVFVLIGFYFGFMRIYKKLFNNVIEVVTYLNLILLSSVTLANIQIPALVYTSVGIMFITFKSLCVYHLYIFYMPQKCLNFNARIMERFKRTAPDRPLLLKDDTSPTRTVIEVVREPLLEET